jgi:hypothetical protein
MSRLTVLNAPGLSCMSVLRLKASKWGTPREHAKTTRLPDLGLCGPLLEPLQSISNVNLALFFLEKHNVYY